MTSSSRKGSVVNPFARNDLRTGSNSPTPAREANQNRKRGRPIKDYPSKKTPSIKEIIGLAKFYEGEGHFRANSTGFKIDTSQNDREVLDWCCKYFGGVVTGPYLNSAGNDYYKWVVVRERALGIMLTIFTFLTKGRREQFIDVLQGRQGKRKYQKTISEEGISEEYVKRNLVSSLKRSDKSLVLKGKKAKGMNLFGVRR